MDFKLYTVASDGVIDCLGGIQGPLTTPSKMDFIDVLAMVKKGYELYEHNPSDLTEKVRVTINNINSIRFTSTRTNAINRRQLNEEVQAMDKAMKVAVVSKDDVKKEKPEPLKAPEENKNKGDKKSIKNSDFTA